MDFTSEKSVLRVDFNSEIQFRISWISFLPFDWEIRTRICKTVLENSGLLFANYACACKTAVGLLRTVFQILFRISQLNGKNENPKTDNLSLKSFFRISRSIANPKSGFENLNPDFPIERTLKILFRCTAVFKVKATRWLYKSQRIFIYAVQKQASLAVQNSHSTCWLQQLFWSKKRKQIY